MSDNTQPIDDRERLPKEAEDQAKQEDAIMWGAFGGEEPTPEQMKTAKEALEKRQKDGPGEGEPSNQ
jgi:hypothetical protein